MAQRLHRRGRGYRGYGDPRGAVDRYALFHTGRPSARRYRCGTSQAQGARRGEDTPLARIESPLRSDCGRGRTLPECGGCRGTVVLFHCGFPGYAQPALPDPRASRKTARRRWRIPPFGQARYKIFGPLVRESSPKTPVWLFFSKLRL